MEVTERATGWRGRCETGDVGTFGCYPLGHVFAALCLIVVESGSPRLFFFFFWVYVAHLRIFVRGPPGVSLRDSKPSDSHILAAVLATPPTYRVDNAIWTGPVQVVGLRLPGPASTHRTLPSCASACS